MRSGRSDRNKNTSKFISLILRHKPEMIGITLDEHGWADVRELIDGINQSEGHTLDMEILEEIVQTDEKQRYSFNEDHTLIRANQGHSIPVDVELEEKTPPDILWHGTGEKYVASIDAQGAGSMCIFLQIRKQQRKWAAGTAGRSFMKLTAGRWQRMDIGSSNRPIMSG